MEIVEVTPDGVRLRNMKGEFLSENLDWSETPSPEQIFTVVKNGESQAFRTLGGKYLMFKDPGQFYVSHPHVGATTAGAVQTNGAEWRFLINFQR